MRARCWVELKGRKELGAFAAAVIIVIVFSTRLPTEAWTRTSGGRLAFPPLPVVMIVTWIAGWGAALFLRAEDLRVLAPINYQAIYRGTGVVSIVASIGIAAMLYMRYLTA